MLAVPEPTRTESSQPAEDARHAITPEQLQRRAQSRGLWTNSDELPAAPTAQSRAESLPRAVVGSPSPASAANTNYQSPKIGSTDSFPAQPSAAAQPGPQAPAAQAAQAQLPTDVDGQTLSVRPELEHEPSVRAPEAVNPDTLEVPLGEVHAQPPTTAPAPSSAQPSPPNTTLWLALILIAAVVAIWFIGAAIGLWTLPWSPTSSGRNLHKAIPAKSLPEMHAVQPQQQPAAPAATPTPPAPPAPEGERAAVMEAEEAAPLRPPPITTSTLDDLMDPPSPEVAPTLAEARAELRAGRPKEAEALLRPLIERYPDDYHVGEALAQTLLARGAAVEAVGFAQRIVKKQPKRASYRVLLGDALRRAGDEPSAKLAYKDALALDPKLREAQRRLKNRKLSGSP